MITEINSPLQGIYADRFRKFAHSFSRPRVRGDEYLRQEIVQREIDWVNDHQQNVIDALAFKASLRILLDLVRHGWELRTAGYGIELLAPSGPTNGLSPAMILETKQQTRDAFRSIREVQMNSQSCRSFITRMEHPSSYSGKHPVTNLIACGEEIHRRIQDKEIEAVQPYLQLITTNSVDKFTNHKLHDVWRYCRYTWSVPQFSTPGRQLLYLVRDASQANHAIMAILGINNSPMQLGVDREKHLGWNVESIIDRLYASTGKQLQSELAWMNRQLDRAIAEIDTTGLIEHEEMQTPTDTIIDQLRYNAERFKKLRLESLKDAADQSNIASSKKPYTGLPVADKVLNLEPKATNTSTMQTARRYLISRKRASLMSKLLQAKLTLSQESRSLIDPQKLDSVLSKDTLRTAFNTIQSVLKSRYAGSNMMEITTCGAIAPYNELLAGKLAALVALSPQIAHDYCKLYGNPSIIASQIKNEFVYRPPQLVYLGTSSLYQHGSSQYNRLKLPAKTFAKDQPELRYNRIGKTSGYGTLQFSDDTSEAVERYLNLQQKYSNINSIFGEGPSPKLRKLVAGLKILGFPPDQIMRHNRQRIVYAIWLCSDAKNYLNSRPARLPSYITTPDGQNGATRSIIEYWQRRWLGSRLRYRPSMDRLEKTKSWKLSEQLPSHNSIEETSKSSNSTPIVAMSMPLESTLWFKIAQAGSQVTSDSLTKSELRQLHVEQAEIEGYIERAVNSGKSVFLTGNAGDGKTHLLRHLRTTLESADAVTIDDATALMEKGNLSRLLQMWSNSISDGRPLCVAINEYPLHLLCQTARGQFPDLVDEIQKQRNHIIVYDSKDGRYVADSGLVLLDLSLRNPLQKNFLSQCLQKIVHDSELVQIADADPDGILAQNLRSLRNEQVQARLYWLFGQLALRGLRVTIRELWIVLARLVIGYRSDRRDCLGSCFRYRYSECLFQRDERFQFYSHMATLDPSRRSHPIWDHRLEARLQIMRSGWAFGDEPIATLQVHLRHNEFVALKRAFYFEHRCGHESFDLEPDHIHDFEQLVRTQSDDDSVTRRAVVGAVNRAYCSTHVDSGISDKLFLWTGHRFHEQPSRVFIANRGVAVDDLRLHRPHVAAHVRQAFPDYIPDHIGLLCGSDESVCLRIDFALFETLSRIRNGLPRRLIPDRDTFRLESFLDRLGSLQLSADRRILVSNQDRRELLIVDLSSDRKRYESVQKIGY